MDVFFYFLADSQTYDYDYDYIMAPQRGRPYGANLGSMGRNTGTWSIRSATCNRNSQNPSKHVVKSS